ncbi:hypothetical protein FOA52_001532 [Chlamydomonas sp. UWO 241]|nr:hypothetical protein FOA52_001532 [Chlamydomonas sp. UWO 241]
MPSGYPPLLVSSTWAAQEQHTKNLRALLHSCLDSADFKSAASVAAVLLCAQKPSVGLGTIKEDRTPQHAREFDQLLHVCAEILRREDVVMEQVRVCLRKMIQAHASPHEVEITRMLAATLMIEGGEMDQALALLEVRPLATNAHAMRRAAQPYACHALTGLIKHRQLLSILKETAASSGTQLRGARPSVRTLQSQWQPQAAAAPDAGASTSAPGAGGGYVDAGVFAYDSRLWLRASSSRATKEVWRETERHLKAALALFPAATLLSFALVHAYVVAGRFTAALDAARAAAGAAPGDVDALALHDLARCAWLEQRAAQGDGGDGDGGVGGGSVLLGGRVLLGGPGTERDAGHARAHQLLRVLRVDGAHGGALDGLLSVCGHCAACDLRCALGCMAHLDMVASGAPLPRARAAWRALAATLCALAEEMLQEDEDGGSDEEGGGGGGRTEWGADEREDGLGEAGWWAAARDERRGGGGGGGAGARGERGDNDGMDVDADPDPEPQAPSSARARWRVAARAMAGRAYWWERALSPPPPDEAPPAQDAITTTATGEGGTHHERGEHACRPGVASPTAAVDQAYVGAACVFVLGPHHGLPARARASVDAALAWCKQQEQQQQQQEQGQEQQARARRQPEASSWRSAEAPAELEAAAGLLRHAGVLAQRVARSTQATAAVAADPCARLPTSWWELFPNVRRHHQQGQGGGVGGIEGGGLLVE